MQKSHPSQQAYRALAKICVNVEITSVPQTWSRQGSDCPCFHDHQRTPTGNVKCADTAAVIVPQQAVRRDARSNLEIKESCDEIAEKTLGGQKEDRQIVMTDQHNTLNYRYKKLVLYYIIVVTNVPVECAYMRFIKQFNRKFAQAEDQLSDAYRKIHHRDKPE